MPYTTIVSGTTITTAWANANVRDQVITPFADNSARASAISSPVTGQHVYITGTNRLEAYTGSLFVPIAGAMPRCHAYRSSAQGGITTGATHVVNWDSELYDTDSIHDTASVTSRFTVPTGMGGLWFCSYSISFVTSGAGLRQAWIQHSSGSRRYAMMQSVGYSGGEVTLTGAACVTTSQAEYFELYVYQDSGSTLSVGTITSDHMQVRYMGPS